MPEEPALAPKRVKLPVKQLLLVLGVAATVYAATLLIWGDSPRSSLARLVSWTGLQAGALCLLNYLLRGMRWRITVGILARCKGCVFTWRAMPSRPPLAMSASRCAA